MHRADSETHNPCSVVEKQAKELNPCTQVESCRSGGSALHFLLWLTFGTPRIKGQGWGWLTPLMGKHKWLRGSRELEEDLGTSGMLSPIGGGVGAGTVAATLPSQRLSCSIATQPASQALV